ncbi:flagellar biosynthesis anti-sigma factor FlgM [Gracilibacillus sp. YIM 98692]|uniref:flagellar biosynthesis anti-sigma factor FlgM n=1 Tax=Gracilibacillus sp. YIM 98692 TaxID=2663532 RepID=UPI0013D63289|nr:flagellar biosynthesis anti-sigma factor FlgM [Gracilibacillus sp. YIM 98692]
MKIHGPNHANLNPYQKQIQKQQEAKQTKHNQEDQVEISNKAKQLQNKENPIANRQNYVNDIKQQVEAGEYQINTQEAAKKILNFWKK